MISGWTFPRAEAEEGKNVDADEERKKPRE